MKKACACDNLIITYLYIEKKSLNIIELCDLAGCRISGKTTIRCGNEIEAVTILQILH
jgi:hypothetical protein